MSKVGIGGNSTRNIFGNMKRTEKTNFTLTVIVNDDGSDVVDVDSAADVYVYACVCE